MAGIIVDVLAERRHLFICKHSSKIKKFDSLRVHTKDNNGSLVKLQSLDFMLATLSLAVSKL